MSITRWVIPTYDYGPKTTLGGLLEQFLKANPGATVEDLSDAIGRGGSNVPQWLRSEYTTALTSTALEAFERVTGISIDRLLVLNAKLEVLRQQPDLSDRISFDRLTTRAELVAELRVFVEVYYNNQPFCIDVQLDMSEGRTSHWLSGKRNPGAETLPTLVEGIARGFIEGTRDDVVFILMVREMFGADPQEIFPGGRVTNFFSAIKEIFHEVGSRSPFLVSQKTGIKQHTVQRLLKYTEEVGQQAKTTEETVLDVVQALAGIHFASKMPMFDRARQEFEQHHHVEHKVDVHASVTLPAVHCDPVPLEPRTAAPEPVPPPAPAVLPSRDLAIAQHHRELARHHAALADLHDPPSGEVAQEVRSFVDLVGVTVRGIKHCFSQANIRGLPGETVSEAQREAIRQAIELLRKLFVLCAGLDYAQQEKIKSVLDSELDELWVAAEAFNYANPAIAQGLSSTIELVRGVK